MHTSVPQKSLQYTGVLLHQAQARTAVLDVQGHSVPVLCLDLELDCPLRNHMHVEQPFPPGQHAQAAAAAHRLKKGMRVTVEAPLIGVRLVATNATHIHAAADAAPLPQEPAEPCQKSLSL